MSDENQTTGVENTTEVATKPAEQAPVNGANAEYGANAVPTPSVKGETEEEVKQRIDKQVRDEYEKKAKEEKYRKEAEERVRKEAEEKIKKEYEEKYAKEAKEKVEREYREKERREEEENTSRRSDVIPSTNEDTPTTGFNPIENMHDRVVADIQQANLRELEKMTRNHTDGEPTNESKVFEIYQGIVTEKLKEWKKRIDNKDSNKI